MKIMKICLLSAVVAIMAPCAAFAQKYGNGVIDKSVAVVDEEMIKISTIEDELRMARASGILSDRNMRCVSAIRTRRAHLLWHA